MAKFSNDGEDVIKRKTDSVSRGKLSEDDLWRYYELDKCLDFLQLYEKVSLQFPDHLLSDSVAIATILKAKCGKDVFILGDTSYGSCCVDEVAAEHISSDAIIHFGPSCLSRTKRLPVLYVFGCEEIDSNDLMSHFHSTYPHSNTPILILYDVIYSHAIESFKTILSASYSNLVFSDLSLTTSNTGMTGSISKSSSNVESHDDHVIGSTAMFGRVLNTSRPLTDYSILYIGSEGPTLTNFMLTLKENTFHSYDPRSRSIRHETVSVNKMLGRRYYLVQRAKEAMTVGILIGTLGVEDYIPMIERLKKVMRSTGKKFYTVAVGKVNPAKLANLAEIDIYVLVACPECSLLQSQDFYRPVVTPFEMEVACLSNRDWTGNVVLDYRDLLKSDVNIPDSSPDSIQPDISLISGRLVNMDGRCGQDTPTNSTDVVLRNGSTELVTQQYTGADHLLNRTWQGLERNLGEKSEIVGVVEGIKGVASKYSHENEV